MVLAVALLAAGGLVFSLGARLQSDDRSGDAPDEGIRWPPWPALAFAALAVVLFAYLLLNLEKQRYKEWYPYLLVASVVAFGFFWGLKGRLRIRFSRPRWATFFEVAAVAVVAATFMALLLHDLTSWYYSANGDEYSFFTAANEIGHGVTRNLFSQTGVYGNHPWLTSAYQAMVMKVLGFNQFGWKMTSVLSALAVIPPLYLLVRMFFGVRTGLLSIAFFAASHYILNFAHFGYDNLFPLFPTVLALYLVVLGLRKGNTLALFGAGCAAGLGFYTFYSSRAAIVIIALYLLTFGRRGVRPQVVLSIGAGFLLLVAPIFAVNKLDVIRAMSDQSVVGYDKSFVGEITTRFRINAPLQTLAFNVSHAPIGSLLDPITAVLAVLGLFYAFLRIRNPGCRLLAIWFLTGIVVTGMFYPKPDVAVTRLMFMVPVMAVFAALALDRLLKAISLPSWPRPGAATVLQGTLAVAVVAGMLTWNVHRLWQEVPERSKRTPEAVAVRALFSSQCQSPALIVGKYVDPLLKPVIAVYSLGDRTPRIASFDQVLGTDNFPVYESCVIVLPEPGSESEQVLACIRQTMGTYVEGRTWDRAGITYVETFYRR